MLNFLCIQLFSSALMLVSDQLAARPFAATPCDHCLLFHGYRCQWPRCFGLSSSGIAPELNWSQLYAICRSGQSGKVIDLLARRCLPLGHPSVASGACAVIQISSSKRQSGERQASQKAALHSSSQEVEVSIQYWLKKHSVDYNTTLKSSLPDTNKVSEHSYSIVA